MSIVKTNIYVLSCVLVLVHGKEKKTTLSLQKLPHDGPKMKFENTKAGTNYDKDFYSYEYSEKNGGEVYIACTPDDSVLNGTLSWEIHTNEKHTSCKQKSRLELNYITKLDATQNGNYLVCILTSNKTTQASAQVTFRCSKCNDSVPRQLKAACYSEAVIATYVNGVYKNNNEIIIANRNQELNVYCQIQADKEHYVYVTSENTFTGELQIINYSNSVIMYKVTMTDLLVNKTISCQKRLINTYALVAENQRLFLLKSDLSIEIEQNNHQLGSTYRRVTELPYRDNDTIKLTCTWNGSADIPLVIEKNGQLKKTEYTGGRIEYQTKLTREDVNITCLLKENNDEIQDFQTIIMIYKKPENVIVTSTTESFYAEASPSVSIRDIEWVGLGLATVFLVVGITYVACRYKLRKPVAPTALENTLSNNVQNSYEPQDRPTLEPTYAGPADDLEVYSYTYNLKTTQDTYSTPFVPTIEEMYTKPIPKNSKAKQDLVYQLPGKVTYANLQGARQNQTEPGYSYVSSDISDTTSDIYTYCSPTGYSRPK